MGNTQEIISTMETQATLDRQVSFENEFELIKEAPDYEKILYDLTISWMPRSTKQILSSFLNATFAGSSECLYMKRAESHMAINFQQALGDEEMQLSKTYLKQFRGVWFTFDPSHTGTILFSDVLDLIYTLHAETNCETWRYDPSEYDDICKYFPNTVITYLEFCLWAEYGESYADIDHNRRPDSEDNDLRWSDPERIHRCCYLHGEIYCATFLATTVLEQIMNAYVETKQKYLSVEELRSFVEKQRHYREDSLMSETLDDLDRRVKYRVSRMILVAESREYPDKLRMYDMCLNLFRPLVFWPSKRRKPRTETKDNAKQTAI